MRLELRLLRWCLYLELEPEDEAPWAASDVGSVDFGFAPLDEAADEDEDE